MHIVNIFVSRNWVMNREGVNVYRSELGYFVIGIKYKEIVTERLINSPMPFRWTVLCNIVIKIRLYVSISFSTHLLP